jgi:hypothetical protein
MATRKTNAEADDAGAFIEGLTDERRRDESRTIDALLREVTSEPPVMWGASIVGYGTFDYLTGAGRKDTWFRIGFSPRKQQQTLYLMSGFDELSDDLAQLGPHGLGKSCLYIKRLDAVDHDVLRRICTRSLALLPELPSQGAG